MRGDVSTSELADELGVTRETVARWISEGRIAGGYKHRGRWRIPLHEAEAVAEGYRSGHYEEPYDGFDEDDEDDGEGWKEEEDEDWDEDWDGEDE